eukprot:TRINITY_DN2339_c0_g3_i1.p1 TRINITY_DN2339_c0_g3~~TRINITY_DN2339_c0_g3_i1.p1  ORF type:complete len:199 (-),score=16.72 TRINITY_DN2339_c0_g3_i1:96-692(-)
MDEWKPFGLTYVLYKRGSHASQALALITLTPILAKFCILGAFVVSRRIEWVWALLGGVFVDGVCLVLKEIINEPRPEGSYRSGPGMPSEHAAVAAFYAVHFCLLVANRVRAPKLLKAFAITALLAWVVLVAVSRYHLGVHSLRQLLVGAVLGSCGGCFSAFLERVVSRPLATLQNHLDTVWKWLDVSYVAATVEKRVD